MVDKRRPMTCAKHGEYLGDAPDSPCPTCDESFPEASEAILNHGAHLAYRLE